MEDEIREATRSAKTDSQAQQKARLILTKWMREPGDESNAVGGKKFKDPMDVIKKAKQKRIREEA